MNRSKGFTLIELLIVVAIIAILAAIAVPNFLEAQARAKVSASKANMKSTITALEAYRIDNKAALPAKANYWSWTIRWGYQWCLTSPVAYMTSALQDPIFRSSNMFGPDYFYDYHVNDNNVIKANLANEHAPGFWDREQWSTEMNNTIRTFFQPVFTNWGKNGASFCIMGRGPGGVSGQGWDGFTYGRMLYDPSNGTVSAGEVVLYN